MAYENAPWRDKDLLYEKYHKQGLDKSAIASEFGCSDVTVHNWMQRLGVPTARARERESFLKSLYIDKGMKQWEIADRLDCHQTTICTELMKNGIETRDAEDYQELPFYFHQGYLATRHRTTTKDGESKRNLVYIHRLIAVAKYGVDALEGKYVHHKNGHKCDNRHENIELVSKSEHAEIHHKRGDIIRS